MRRLIKPHSLGQNMNLEKKCLVCGIIYPKPKWISQTNWELRKYCSTKCQSNFWKGKPGRKLGHKGQKAWNKGIPQTTKVKEKLSRALKIIAKQKGFGKWMLGKKLSFETRKKQSIAMKKRIAEGRHNFYIDGRTPKNKIIRHSVEFKFWRDSVFRRDNYTCQECGTRNGNGKSVYLHAHHIKPFAHYPELRFEISNGLTLCKDCHAKTDTYKGRVLKYKK